MACNSREHHTNLLRSVKEVFPIHCIVYTTCNYHFQYMTSRKYIVVLLKPVDIFSINCWSKGCNWSLPLVLRGRGVPLVQALRGVPSRRIYINIMRLRKHNYVLVTQFLPENKNYAKEMNTILNSNILFLYIIMTSSLRL